MYLLTSFNDAYSMLIQDLQCLYAFGAGGSVYSRPDD